jgi:hypothetical protein
MFRESRDQVTSSDYLLISTFPATSISIAPCSNCSATAGAAVDPAQRPVINNEFLLHHFSLSDQKDLCCFCDFCVVCLLVPTSDHPNRAHFFNLNANSLWKLHVFKWLDNNSWF